MLLLVSQHCFSVFVTPLVDGSVGVVNVDAVTGVGVTAPIFGKSFGGFKGFRFAGVSGGVGCAAVANINLVSVFGHYLSPLF